MSVPVSSPISEDRVEPYALPLVEGRVVTRHGEITTGNIPTADDISSLIEQSKAEGYTVGYQEGLLHGQEEVTAQIALLAQIAQQLDSPLDAIDDEVIQSIAGLIGVVAKNVVRRQLVVEPDEVVGVVRDAVKQLPLSDRKITVHLNPSDADILNAALGEQSESQSWNVQSDPSLTPGGCVVNTDVSTVDATLETRIGQIVSAMVGDERKNAQ